MNGAGRAYLTLAVGDRRYLEMAVDLALSLRAWTALPIVLAADDALAARADASFRGIFTEVVLLQARFLEGRARKFGVAAVSRFDETLYIDSDCIVVSDPSSLWDAAGGGPLTMAGEMLLPTDSGYHHGFSTRAIIRQLGLRAYFKTNSGVFHFRREGGREALEACLRCHQDEVRRRLARRFRPWRYLGDEIAFGVVGGRRGFETFGGPGPMYWADEIRALDLARPTKPVLHFIAPIPAATLDGLLEGVVRRRREARLSAEGSVEIWRREARKSGLSWIANQAIRRMIRSA